jgi:1-phosphatidylinositol-3-phosphate 5-kinase
LLKGASSEELKSIKRVLHFTVFAAYHLILETSFFADQKLFTTDRITTGKHNCFESEQQLPDKNIDTIRHDIPTCDVQYANMEGLVHHTEKSVSLQLHDSKIKISEDPADGELVDRKAIQPYSSLPVSHPSINSAQGISSSHSAEPTMCDGFDRLRFSAISDKVTMQKKDVRGGNCQDTVDDGKCTEAGAALNSQDILISMSSQHIRNQAVCEQSHLSRITYYGYFDTSLGRYLQDTLLNEVTHLSCFLISVFIISFIWLVLPITSTLFAETQLLIMW